MIQGTFTFWTKSQSPIKEIRIVGGTAAIECQIQRPSCTVFSFVRGAGTKKDFMSESWRN